MVGYSEEWTIDPTGLYIYTLYISSQYTCDCAVYYVGKVYTRVTDEDLYKDGKFHASEKVRTSCKAILTVYTCMCLCATQLCIILNNMFHLEQALEGLSESLELDKYYQVSPCNSTQY